MTIEIPEFALVLLVGASGTGKSSFIMSLLDRTWRCFAWSFQSEPGHETGRVSADWFALALLRYLGEKARAHESVWDRALRISEHLKHQRMLVNIILKFKR